MIARACFAVRLRVSAENDPSPRASSLQNCRLAYPRLAGLVERAVRGGGDDGRWMYLATVIDLYSRRLVGYSMADHMRADLVIDALHAAVQSQGGNVTGVIFHTDRGSQYSSTAFAQACAAAGVCRSMGAVGSSADNALAESFFASLKREILPTRGWPTIGQARLAVFGWLTFYNTRQRHSALGYLSPAGYETRSTTTLPTAA
ncbi:IS3 family transposase [Actinomadura scrupuli]|uniref:IS3 family transposase n=1 Tax=Actinomadura scrupuli TaxID=559629 RepID=UPI003D9A09F4